METNNIPKEHQLECEGCGKILDMRDLSCLGHGWIENGEIVCYDLDGVHHSSSRKVTEPILWTRGKKPIYLN